MVIVILNKTQLKKIYIVCFSFDGSVTDMNMLTSDKFGHMGF